MSDNPGQGQSLGKATATILMVADKFADGARVVQKVSTDAGKSVDGMAGAFDRAKKAAQDFDNSKLGKIQQSIKAVTDQLKIAGAVAAGITLFGVKAAQDVNRTRTSIELLTGSVQKADKVFADIRKLTDRFNVPFDDAIQGAQAFLPIAKTTGVAIDDLVKSAIRFQAYNPRKSFDEIKFSINEALSGDFVSIKDTLDLSRKQRDELKRLLEEEGASALLEGLDQILIERGFDDKTLEKLGESGANAFEQIKSEIKETMAVAFTPLLKDFVLPTIKSFGEFLRNLRETNPDLLKFAGGVTAIVAAGVPLLTFLGSAISAYKALKVASAGLNLGGVGAVAGRVAGVGVAVAGGVELGVAGAKALANAGVRTGDLGRVAAGEDPKAILGERIKQVIVLIANAILEFGRFLTEGGLRVKAALEGIGAVFKLGGAVISQIINEIKRSVGVLLQSLADQFSGLGDTTALRNIGKAISDDAAIGVQNALNQRDEALQTLSKGFVPTDAEFAELRQRTQENKDKLLSDLTGFLFPMTEEVEKAKPVFDNTTRAIRETNKALGDSEEYLAQQAEDIANATKKYNDEVTEAELKKQQDIIELNQKFADEQIEIARNRVKEEAKALEDLNNDLRKLDTELTRETEKEGRERQRKNIELQVEFTRQELEDSQAHLEKLEDIRRTALKREQDALENFDFASLFDISEDLKEQTDSAAEEFEKQRQERVQALQYEREDLVREFGAQREERLIQYEQDRADRQAQYEQDRTRIANEAAERLMLAQQAHANDMVQLTNKYTAEQQLRQQAYANELTLLMQTEAQRVQIIAQAQEALLQQAYSFMNRARPGSGGGGNGSLSPAAIAAYNDAMQQQRDYHRQAERQGKTTYGTGGRESGRAYGGPVLGGRSYPVNEIWNENFVRGTQVIPLPNGAGTFIPNQSGDVRPNRSTEGRPQMNVTVQLNAPIDSGILTVDKAVALIRQAAQQGAEEVLSEWMQAYER